MVEPDRTPYDLQFHVAGIPIRVHPFFWLASAFLAVRPELRLVDLLLWIAVVFVSIVVHELGHAFAFRRYGTHSHIVLYTFGGLAIPDSSGRLNTPWRRMFVALAGPVAGFLFAGLVAIGILALGRKTPLFLPFFEPFYLGWGEPIRSVPLMRVLNNLIYVNLFWGVVNLLPVYPLDGGQFFREVLSLQNPRDGLRQSLLLSILTAGGIALVAYARFNDFYLALMFAYLGYLSFQMLQSLGGYGGGWHGR